MNAKTSIKIAMIGPAGDEIGGTVVSFHHLIQDLSDLPGVSFVVVNTSGVRGAGIKAPFRLASLMWQAFSAMRRCDITVLHAMPTALPFIGWYFPPLAWVCRKPYVFRSFGGKPFTELRPPGRTIARFCLQRANLVLLQTQELMTLMRIEGLNHIKYFPTARPMPGNVPKHRGVCRRFIYVGHLKVAKGLQYLARVARRLPDGVSVTVFGPWYDLPRDTFEKSDKISYLGNLKPTDVRPTLMEYDALVLPSFMSEEGHPGIVLEAYSVGLPVIATRWKALPEIVIDEVSGLLVEPQDEDALFQAMKRLCDNSALVSHLADGTASMRTLLSQERQTKLFLELCKEVIEGGKNSVDRS